MATEGLTKRDVFAMVAMHALWTCPEGQQGHDTDAETCYLLADEMLKASGKTNRTLSNPPRDSDPPPAEWRQFTKSIGGRAQKALAKSNVVSFETLRELTDLDLLKHKNCGRGTIDEIKKAMEGIGMELKQERWYGGQRVQ